MSGECVELVTVGRPPHDYNENQPGLHQNSWRSYENPLRINACTARRLQFKQQFGPSRANVAKAKELLESAGFTIVAERTQNLEVEGPVSAVERMFNTKIERVQVKPGHTKLAAAERH
jgi:Pro-kumamolisin, activation domain